MLFSATLPMQRHGLTTHESQQKEIRYLIDNKAEILVVTRNCAAVINCIANLEDARYWHYKKDDGFTAREKLINDLNAAIIRARISRDSTTLYCIYCHLTRFPACVLSDPALQDYWAALETLFLDFNKLTVLPAAIGRLAALQSLNLIDNKLTVLPDEMGQLAALQVLLLNDNQLTVLPEIGRLVALQTLALRSNRLINLPAGMAQLAALQTLDLSFNELTALPQGIERLVPPLGRLLQCYLENNQLTQIPDDLAETLFQHELFYCTKKITPRELMLTQRPQQLAQEVEPVIETMRLRNS